MSTQLHPDTDYLYISARLKSLEKNMLGRDKLTRLASMKTGDEAVKLLSENGWGDFSPKNMAALEEQIDLRRQSMFDLLYRYAPDLGVLSVFRFKYDYHNLKTLTKAQAMGEDAQPMLSSSGNIPPQRISAIFREKSYHELAPIMRNAVTAAVDVLARTGDPQLSDLALDRAMIDQMLEQANETNSSFLMGYVRLFIDLANLRVIVRAARAAKGYDYLKRAVSPGGTVAPERLYSEATSESVTASFVGASLGAPAQAAAQALGGNASLSALDMACDNALISYVKSARYLSFGVAGVIAYLVATEAELTSVRTVMSGRNAGLSEDKIIERLRICYV